MKDKLKFDIEEVKRVISESDDALIYLGCDSIRTKKKTFRYATVVVVHYGAKNGSGRGAKVFGKIDYDKVQDAKASRPINRMLAEVNRIIEMYNLLEDVLVDRVDDLQIHLDINPDERHGSSVAYGAARGMIQGMIGIEPLMKPFSFAASFCADHYIQK